MVESGAGLAPLELRAELDEFAHIFSAPATSEGVVRLRVTAVAPGGRAQRLVGQFVDVAITEALPNSLRGRVVTADAT